MRKLSKGMRDSTGKWHPDNPGDYPEIAVHGIWPWSVLDQNSKAWQARKKHWEDIGVDAIWPRQGRGAMIATGRHGSTSGGVSRFDPVLAEIAYSWYCPPAGRVFDPFAGGPVRGIVAHSLGHDYEGVDISHAQVEANRERATQLGYPDMWIEGDALTHMPGMGTETVDYILACPPYWNRERYTDLPADLSRMSWPDFLEAHAAIITECARVLRQDRFITWVISDLRDYRGTLRGLPSLTVTAFAEAGMRLINEQVLYERAGLRAKTTRPAWDSNRTTTRRHQYVLTFVKGDRGRATEAIRCS